MRFVIHGAGAIGGVLGGRFADAGHDVVLIARGRHLDKIRADGLTIESAEGAQTLRIPVVGHPGEINWQRSEIVMLAVKSMDTVAALSELAMVADAHVPICCVQNGVANERAALRRFRNVYGVHVMVPALHLMPGVVQANSTPITGILDVGHYPDGVDRTTVRVAEALESATFRDRKSVV